MLPAKKFASKLASLSLSLGLGAALACGAGDAAFAAPKKDFKLAWSIYVGWMPWQWANDNGIVKKWADKYGIKIDVVQFNDYVELINQYTAGAFDALTVTNMDTVAVPAVGGVDSTAVIVGDFSNGNDAVILKDKTELAAIKGQKVNLVQFSVSHYLLDRALASIGLLEKDVTVVNTSDADMAAAFATPEVTAVTTWNPITSEILQRKDAHNVFNSSQIPGEIMDLAVANTKILADNPDFGKALAGIWYETHVDPERENAGGRGRARGHGQSVGNRSRRLRVAAEDDAHVLHAGRRRRLHEEPGAAEDDETRQRLPVRAWPAWRQRQKRRRDRDFIPRRLDHRRSGQDRPAFRHHLHGIRRYGAEIRARRRCASSPIGRTQRASLLLPAIPFILLIALYSFGSILRHAGNPDDKLLPRPRKPRGCGAARRHRARQAHRRDHPLVRHGGEPHAARPRDCLSQR